jgi:hypothetical protein
LTYSPLFEFVAPQKNRAKPEKQKGKKEGGLGEGIFALLLIKIERFRFSLIKRNTKQKNFLFLLKEKIAREKIKKCRENFSVLVCRSGAEASGNPPHSCSGFSLKKVRISFSVRSFGNFYTSSRKQFPPEADRQDNRDPSTSLGMTY